MPGNCKLCGGKVVSGEHHGLWPGANRCAACGAVLAWGEEPRPGAGALTKDNVKMPPGYEFSMQGTELVILRRWYGVHSYVILAFCVFWAWLLAYWALPGFEEGMAAGHILFLVLHALSLAALAYYTAAKLLNTTKIAVSTGELRVSHYPVTWPGGRTLQRQDIAQFFCRTNRLQVRKDTITTYDLLVLGHGRDELALVTGLEKPEEALFLERAVESHLGIGDKPVDGELRTA